MDIDKIQTAFFPSKEITNPEFFVGRSNEIKNLIQALSEQGSFIAIHGLRGVGKSSIAKQLRLIAEGDLTLPKMLKLERYIPNKKFNFLTITTTCDGYTHDVSDVIKRIIFGDNEGNGLLGLTSTGDRKIESIKETFKAGGSGGLFGIKIEAGGQEEINYKTTFTDDLVQQFKQLLSTVQKDNQNKSGLLIIVDEFDVLQNKTGFGSLIKTCSNDFVKFAVSGIANTVTELIEDHISIGRQLHPISVNKMPKEELFGILKRAEHHVSNKITFDDNSVDSITTSAEGFPYFVHLIGKQAFLKAFDVGKNIITDDDINEIKTDISSGRLRTIYEEIYHSAVKESAQRELLLKFFAEEEKDEIYTVSVYSNAKDLGVTNPSQLMKELTQPQDGSLGVLVRLREQYYRFTDPVFKVYAKLRTWKFSNT
jgi:Cdc6-like AAA superfamily ATPase